ncbi:TonB-dependent receptor [Niastella koreensis]|uniref:TonB-dependent receptor n=2 Tax=Niastella koreensis TaxID=354356 RepID=G8TCE2_NIAKG|nr:TonB-dependent receptor [Niastella koreensis]AEW01449.1 TonB-dependent receptor [Niastella koreensis GR20-10]OQP48179.1 TonB-dependent receptor [Niastella koreensis]
MGYDKKMLCVIACSLSAITLFAQEQTPETDTTHKVHVLQEIVISASRLQEKQLAAPVSISKLSNSQIQQTTGHDFFDAIGTMKGVHMIVPGMGFKIINTRGFSNTTNVRFVQMIDNIDNQSPHIGAPIANALSPGDLDIDHVEVIQGVASALYGMNATNGLANFTTKDPFITQGFSIQQQIAVNHVNDPNDVSARLYNETNLRWAKVIGTKWAFKINAGYNRGYDWVADNRSDLFPTGNATTNLYGADNPAYDAVNGYGNESSNRKTLTLAGKNYVVARTGYYERDVADYNLQNVKGDVSLYFRPTENSQLSYTYRTAFLNNTYQRSNRFRLQDYLLQQHIVQFRNSLFQARAYITSENTGHSYNLRSAAETLDLSFKDNNKWYADFTNAFNTAYSTKADAAAALHAARDAADNGRYQPGTDAFKDKLKQLQEINNWDIGAALKVKARLVHTEGSFDLGKALHTAFDLHVGADFRDYIIVPDGNYFINPTDSGHNLNYTSYGLFVQASKRLLHDKLQVSAVLRGTGYEYFNLKWNPRLTAVYGLTRNDFVRFSYQNGYRFPSIFEGFSNINSGGVKRVGGLKVMSNGVFENTWLKSSIDAFTAAVNKDVNTSGLSQAAAIEKNKGLLVHNTYTYLQPEQMHSFEVGYRSILFNGRFSVDVDFYYNFYSNFIAQIEGSVPNTTDSAQIPAYLYDKNKQARYRLWTNSKTIVHNYGTEIDLLYLIDNRYSLFGNASYQTLKRTSANDGLEDGFNTPKWMVNGGIRGANVYKGLGFSLSARYQSNFYYQSFLVNGTVPAVFNADAMAQYAFNKTGFTVKLGATNFLNHYYYSILGGPQIGGFYYTTLTYTLK